MEEFYKTAIQKHQQTIEGEVKVGKLKKYLIKHKGFHRSAFTVNGKKLDSQAVLQKLLQDEFSWEDKYNTLLSALEYTGQRVLRDLLVAMKVAEDGDGSNGAVAGMTSAIPIETHKETTPLVENKGDPTKAIAAMTLTIPTKIDEDIKSHAQSKAKAPSEGGRELAQASSSTNIEIRNSTGSIVYNVKVDKPELYSKIVISKDGGLHFILKDSGKIQDDHLLDGEGKLVANWDSGLAANAEQNLNKDLGGDVLNVNVGSIYITIELPLSKLSKISEWLTTGYLCQVLTKALITDDFRRKFGENVILDIIDVKTKWSKDLFSEKGWEEIISRCDKGYENVKATLEKYTLTKEKTFCLQVHMKLCYENIAERLKRIKTKICSADIHIEHSSPTKPHIWRNQSQSYRTAVPRSSAWRMLPACSNLRRTRSHYCSEKYAPTPRLGYDLQVEWFRAVKEGKKERISHLMYTYPYLLNSTNEQKETALIISSANGHTETVSCLLKGNCEVNMRDQVGSTALWKAADLGFKHTVRVLLNCGADIDTPTTAGYTPLMAAISSKHTEVAMFLLLKGCNVNRWYKTETDELTAVHIAAVMGDRNMVTVLIEDKEVDENMTAKWDGVYGYNLLHFACRYGYFELSNYLLIETETSVNASTTNGKMPIDLAIENKHWHIQETLKSNESCKPECMTVFDITNVKRKSSSVSSCASKLTNEAVSNTFYSDGTSILTIDEPYRMNGSNFGVVVIITNTTFSVESGLNTRIGSSLDKERLVASFKRLHLDVHCYDDLRADEIYDCLRHYSSYENNEQSCFVCCISSHGRNGFVYGTDGELVPIITLSSIFAGGNAVYLSGKPKLFIVTACQGNNQGMGKMSYSEVVRKEEIISETDIIPLSEAHFMVCYSTVPGKASYRDVTDGTIFIKILSNNLDKYGEMRDLEDILRNTSKHLGQNPIKTASGEHTQVCLTFNTLQHRFILRRLGSFRDKSSVSTKPVAHWERKQVVTTDNIPTMVRNISIVAFASPDSWNQQLNTNPVVY